MLPIRNHKKTNQKALNFKLNKKIKEKREKLIKVRNYNLVTVGKVLKLTKTYRTFIWIAKVLMGIN